MKLKIDLRRIARRDFDDSAAWYEAQRTGLGLQFTAAVDEAIDQAAEMPMRFPLAHGDARCVRVRNFPYSVLFWPESDRIVVFAIYHIRRDPAGWKSRLG